MRLAEIKIDNIDIGYEFTCICSCGHYHSGKLNKFSGESRFVCDKCGNEIIIGSWPKGLEINIDGTLAKNILLKFKARSGKPQADCRCFCCKEKIGRMINEKDMNRYEKKYDKVALCSNCGLSMLAWREKPFWYMTLV
mgnify:CR=1 FL=1